jgi:tol-pal system protein YbgF
MSFARFKETMIRLSLPALMVLLFAWAGCASEEAVKPETTPPPPPGPTVEQKKIDSLEADNINLKQKIVKLEQDKGTLNARIMDVEAKLKAELEKEAAVPKPPPATYEGAVKAFGEKKYDDAIQMFEALLNGGIAEDQADNCHYWIGESFFGKKQYKDAMKHFEMVFQYKGSEKKADAQYMLARSYEATGDKAKAKEAYEKVTKDYPTSDKVKKAKERWGKL